jgi:hypothetical protein
MLKIASTIRSLRQAAPCVAACALLLVICGVWAGPVEAGCGAYIHFRGSPSMAVNPVARVSLSAVGKEAGLRFADSSPSESPAGEEGCHGPNCSKQRSPYLPQSIQILLLHLPDGIVPRSDSGLDAPTSATLVAEHASLPRQYSLGIFRPPRS